MADMRAPTPRPAATGVSDLYGAPSALSPDAAWMLPSDALVADVESAFAPVAPSRTTPPPYGGLRYTAAWWAARENR